MNFIVQVTIHSFYPKRFRFNNIEDAANFIETLFLHDADNENMEIEILWEGEKCEKD